MPYVGNDVVDLKEPANSGKSRDSRFLKKILTDAEIGFVKKAENPDKALWSFWACKETVYKIIKKYSPDTAFIPRRWQTALTTPHPEYLEGDVIIPERGSVYVRLFSTPEYVHCVGVDNFAAIEKLIWNVEPVPQGKGADPSIYLRHSLEKNLAQNFPLYTDQIKIERTRVCGELQPPRVYVGRHKIDIDISLSHDGRFVAYAFLA